MSFDHHYLTSMRYRYACDDEDGNPLAGASVTVTAIHNGRTTGDALLPLAYPLALTDNGDGTYDYFPPADIAFEPGSPYCIVTLAAAAGLQARDETTVYCRK